MNPPAVITDEELRVLTEFLVGGLLAGVIGHWFDQLTSFIRR